MSLLPLLLTTLTWSDMDRPHRTMLDQNLGFPSFPHIRQPAYPAVSDIGIVDFYDRPWIDMLLRRKDGATTSVSVDQDTFKVMIDVHHFKPEEITVKVVDRCVIVEAKHEEKGDQHGSISRQFIRTYTLPYRADVNQITATISSDGILMIKTLLKPKEPTDERMIKIKLTGQPALRARGEDEGGTTKTSVTQKKAEENEVREELTTQAQDERKKPEK